MHDNQFITLRMSNDAEWKLNSMNSSWSPKSSSAFTRTGWPTYDSKNNKDYERNPKNKRM